MSKVKLTLDCPDISSDLKLVVEFFKKLGEFATEHAIGHVVIHQARPDKLRGKCCLAVHLREGRNSNCLPFDCSDYRGGVCGMLNFDFDRTQGNTVKVEAVGLDPEGHLGQAYKKFWKAHTYISPASSKTNVSWEQAFNWAIQFYQTLADEVTPSDPKLIEKLKKLQDLLTK
jgi:hypothetical protein